MLFREMPVCLRWARLGLIGIVLAVTIYYANIYPGQLPDHPLIFGYNDLMLHAAAFGLLTLLNCVGSNHSWWTLGLLTGFAALIELIQVFDPEREASFIDFLASMVGIGLGWAAAWLATLLLVLVFDATSQGKAK